MYGAKVDLGRGFRRQGSRYAASPKARMYFASCRTDIFMLYSLDFVHCPAISHSHPDTASFESPLASALHRRQQESSFARFAR
jgi:hypothetical protein